LRRRGAPVAERKPSFDFRPRKTTEPPAVRTASLVAGVAFLISFGFGTCAEMLMPYASRDVLGPVLMVVAGASFATWLALKLLIVVVWTPENRFTLRSLILINIFVGTLIGFVVRGGFRPGAGRVGPPEFWVAAAFFAAAVTSLILDDLRWREMKQRRREDEDDDGPARED